MGGYSPRDFTVSGFVPKERKKVLSFLKKERKKEGEKSEVVKRFDFAQGYPVLPVSLVWHGVVSISLHS